MKAIVYRRYGSPSVFEEAEVAKPVPSPDEILVKIYATTVTSADCMMRRGDTPLSRVLLGFSHPKKKYQILGTEFSGIVEDTGKNVKKFRKGDQVYAFRGFGTGCYTRFKCIKEDGSVALKPHNMDFTDAASVVDGASTALFFLNKAGIKPGYRVLINGASGSIGTFAVQLSKYFGAETTGVCSSNNIQLVKSLGADRVIDYRTEDFSDVRDYYDIIFDTVGKSSFSKCRNALSKNGKYISTVMTFSNLILSTLSKFGGRKKVIFSMTLNKTEELNILRGLIESGSIKTVIDQKFELKDIAAAHAYVENGHKKGNVVIAVSH